MEGGGIVSGEAEDNNAYRGENAGIYGLLVKLEYLVKKASAAHHNKREGIVLGSDCLSTLRWVLLPRKAIKAQMKHSDLLLRIQDKIKTIPIPITWVHVQGHQKTVSQKLTPDTILNKKMDKLAKEINQTFHSPTGRQCAGGQCTIRVQGQLITGNIKTDSNIFFYLFLPKITSPQKR